MREPAFLTSESALRSSIPAPTQRVVLKIQPRLESTGRAWIDHARLVGVATRTEGGFVEVTARAAQSVATTLDDHVIHIDDADGARIGDGSGNVDANAFAGAIFLLPGIDSTLRANGAARRNPETATLELAVHETYMHCPKAFVRSKLWDAQEPSEGTILERESGDRLGPDAQRFLTRAPFALLGTCLEDGDADVSPRGDPPGFIQVLDERTLLVPDRPGNRIVDSFRNLLANPVAGLLVFVPGSTWVLRIMGRAHPTADRELLAPSAIRGHIPDLGIWLRIHQAVLEPAPALLAAGLWDATARVDARRLPTVGRAIVEQVEPGTRFHGLKGRMLDWMLAQDARRNLY